MKSERMAHNVHRSSPRDDENDDDDDDDNDSLQYIRNG